jgi:hypothetical protein
MHVVSERVRLELEIEPGGDAFRGLLRLHGGGEWDFTGWLPFLRALEEALAAHGAPSAPRRGSRPA